MAERPFRHLVMILLKLVVTHCGAVGNITRNR
jgi:hypothetical protein